jgi:FeS assembly SUF system protein
MTMANHAQIKDEIVGALRSIYDPEIPVNIYDMGLIYEIDIDDQGAAKIEMTLTSPGCPVSETLFADVESKTAAVDGVTAVKVELVWEPPWSPEMMTEAAQLELAWL